MGTQAFANLMKFYPRFSTTVLQRMQQVLIFLAGAYKIVKGISSNTETRRDFYFRDLVQFTEISALTSHSFPTGPINFTKVEYVVIIHILATSTGFLFYSNTLLAFCRDGKLPREPLIIRFKNSVFWLLTSAQTKLFRVTVSFDGMLRR